MISWSCLDILWAQENDKIRQDRVEILLDSAEHYELRDPLRTLLLAHEVLESIPETGHEEAHFRALSYCANSEKMLDDMEAAVDYADRAIDLANRMQEREWQIRAIYLKATIFGQYEMRDSALVYYQNVIAKYDDSAGRFYLSTSYTQVGIIYSAIGNLDKAEDYLLKGYRLSKADDFARTFSLVPLIQFYLGLDDKRYLQYLDTLALSDFYQNASPLSFISHFESFLLLDDASDEEKESTLMEVFSYSQANSSRINQIGYGVKLVRHLQATGKLDEANALLLTLLDTAYASGSQPHVSDVLQLLYQNSKARGSMREALDYLEQRMLLQEQILSEENRRTISELNIKFETAQKDHAIAQQRERLNQVRRNRNFLIALAFLLGALALVTYFFFRSRAVAARRIAQQEKHIHAQEKQRILKEKEVDKLEALLEMQESERNRIARDLHDGLGSLMSGISAQIEMLRTSTRDGSPYLPRLTEMIKEASGELRRTSYELMPVSLLKQGLASAIHDLSQNLLAKNGIHTELELHDDLAKLTSGQQLIVYRIVQELLNNVVKHAQATNVLIQSTCYDNEISLVVEDDGIGFNVTEKENNAGLGLGSLRNRVNLIDGVIDIASAADKGTTVTVNFKVG